MSSCMDLNNIIVFNSMLQPPQNHPGKFDGFPPYSCKLEAIDKILVKLHADIPQSIAFPHDQGDTHVCFFSGFLAVNPYKIQFSENKAFQLFNINFFLS